MTRESLAWMVMTLLALAVAGYASTVMFAPDLRTSLISSLFSQRPVTTFAHLTGGAVALVAGAVQLNAGLRIRFIGAHRWIGRMYVIAVVIAGAAALPLALNSLGGWVAHAGFGLLAACWIGSTLNAYWRIREGDLSAHRRWMIRSYALTLAAVTLRLYLPSSQLAGFPMAVAYPAIAWLCWLPNLAIAEWFIRSGQSSAILPDSSFNSVTS